MIRQETFALMAAPLVARGWSPLPVRGKRPDLAGSGWNRWNLELPTADVVAEWCSCYPDANTGIAVGPRTVVVDADVLDDSLAAVLAAASDEILGPTPLVRIGRA